MPRVPPNHVSTDALEIEAAASAGIPAGSVSSTRASAAADGSLLLRLALVERDVLPHQIRQRVLVQLLAFAKVDCAPRVPFQARIEETGRVLERCSLGERHLHHV